MKIVLNQAGELVVPDKKYEKNLFAEAKNIVSKINTLFSDAKAIIGGSGAKKTYLKTFDVDIFVLFDYKKYADKSDQISNILENKLKKKFKLNRLHGSRDYFQIEKAGNTFEIIPILKISKAEQAQNITDVSPLHATFVRKYPKLIQDMRLTKQFARAAGVYGAESYIKGFSGYVCEILTVQYGSFQKAVTAISKWKPGAIADVKNYYKNKNVLFELNKSKLSSPLICIDPVDKHRNAAAAVSEKKFNQLVQAAKKFVKKPSLASFVEADVSIADLKKQKNTLVLKATPLKKKLDVAFAKLLKSHEFIVKTAATYDFDITKHDMIPKDTHALFVYQFKETKLPKETVFVGPPTSMKEHVKTFKKKYKKTSTKNGHVVAKIKREHPTAESYLKAMTKNKVVLQNLKKIEVC